MAGRGGDLFDVLGVNVSHKAHGQYSDIIGVTERRDIVAWLMSNARRVRLLSDDSPYYVFESHGTRFVFVRNRHIETPGYFVLVTVQRCFAKELAGVADDDE